MREVRRSAIFLILAVGKWFFFLSSLSFLNGTRKDASFNYPPLKGGKMQVFFPSFVSKDGLTASFWVRPPGPFCVYMHFFSGGKWCASLFRPEAKKKKIDDNLFPRIFGEKREIVYNLLRSIPPHPTPSLISNASNRYLCFASGFPPSFFAAFDFPPKQNSRKN